MYKLVKILFIVLAGPGQLCLVGPDRSWTVLTDVQMNSLFVALQKRNEIMEEYDLMYRANPNPLGSSSEVIT